MPNNRNALLVLLLVLLAGAAFFAYTQYESNQKERSLRNQAEQELQAKLNELSEKESQFQSLQKNQKTAEDALNQKIQSLQYSLVDYDQKIRDLNTQMEALKAENDSLKTESQTKDRKINDLSKRVQELTRQKKEAEDRLSGLADSAASTQTVAAETAAAPMGAYGIREDKKSMPIDTVQLGKIVVQKNSGRAAQIIHTNPIYNFIIVDAGQLEGIRKGQILNIVRDSRIIGKVIVEKIRPNASAAVILPEFSVKDFQVGDQVSVS